ncbi:MAG TPA: hypothetical protein IAB04_03830 [Candidatus Avimonoglobus intestinipullorum]|uniref:Uncharacterized protein n=1 Tax=Candidatus Avimonoglobus intestinipullorum TaxID=2840699 RepID=A0A9D1LUS9_9FIRM|nr:hypothetical protein [Candidatus Avimonoglobus intestinipullorum]
MNKQTTKVVSVFFMVWMLFNALSAAVFAEEEPAEAVFLDGTQLQFACGAAMDLYLIYGFYPIK